MADIVNLRQARKQKTRADKEKKSVENRIKFGRTKLQKRIESMEKEREVKNLDDKKRED